jgi:tellurite resistance protein
MGLFSSIGKIGSQIGAGLTNMVERFGSKQEFEAGMAAVVLVASADGKIDPSEEAAALTLLKTIPAFSAFDSRDIDRSFKEGAMLMGMDANFGAEQLYDKVRAIKDPSARSTIITIALKIAMADGTIADSEKAVIEKLKSL